MAPGSSATQMAPANKSIALAHSMQQAALHALPITLPASALPLYASASSC